MSDFQVRMIHKCFILDLSNLLKKINMQRSISLKICSGYKIYILLTFGMPTRAGFKYDISFIVLMLHQLQVYAGDFSS